MRFVVRLISVFALMLAWFGMRPAEAADRKVYFFGNSLIHHLSDSDETTVPHWLALMAREGGHGFKANGQWGFLRDFARPGAPKPNWSFAKVRSAWRQGSVAFADVGWDAIVVNPANFIQYQSPDTPYDGDNPDGASPLSAMLALIDAHGVAPIYLYEGWSEMASGFPPSKRQFRKYNTYNAGPYHAWYEALVSSIRTARPDTEITLIPVASVLAELFTEGQIAGIDPTLLYVDADPHGTPTLYLLAAMITYSALYNEPAPIGVDLSENIAPELRRAYPLVAQEIWRKLQGNAQASAAPVAPSTPAPKVAPKPPVAPQSARVATPKPEAKPTRAAVGVADPSLAIGLNGVADWTTQQPFVDIMKTARPWLGHERRKWGAWDAAKLRSEGFLDDHGWPIAMPPKVNQIESFILTDQNPEATNMAGRYRVAWQGTGRLRISGRVRNVSRPKGEKEIWFDYTPGEGEVAVTILKTDPEQTGDYIRDITVLREDQIALHDLGVVFNPDWIVRIADFRVLRFMDWMLTNGSPVNTWEGRPKRGDFSYGWRGVPVEVMIELANHIGADPWFNMPHAADDGYSGQFAKLVLEQLDPRLNVFVEYSNEVWNHGFPQAEWLTQEARKRWGDKARDDAWMQFAGMRAAQVMRAWGDVFDDDAAARLVRVVAVHTGWMGLEEAQLEAPLWQDEQGDGAISPAAHFDAYAVTGYFGFELGGLEEGRLSDVRKWLAQSRKVAEASDVANGLQRRALAAAIEPIRFDLAIPKAAEAVREGSLQELTDVLWPYHAKVARARGFRLIMYEGGSHVVGHGEASNDKDLTDFFRVMNYSDEMAALYVTAMDAWRKAGGAYFNAFVDVARPTKFGSWGALRHLQDDNPRWQALIAENARKPDGQKPRDAGAFLHGIVLQVSASDNKLTGTPEEDILLGHEGDDHFVSNGGGDFIAGGAGSDLVLMPGARDDYRFAVEGSRFLLTRNGVSTRLRSIERLAFAAEPSRIYRLELAQ